LPHALFDLGVKCLGVVFLLLVFAPSSLQADFLDFDAGESDMRDYKALPRLRITGELGGAYLLANMDSNLTDEAKSYARKLNLGWAPTAELSYFPWPKGGLGLTYNAFFSQQSENNLVFRKGNPTAGNIADTLTLHYLGLSFLTRSMISSHGILVAGVGVGKLWYSNRWSSDGMPHHTEAGTYGFHVSLAIDQHITGPLAVGVASRFIYGSTRKYKYDGVSYELEDLSDDYYWFDFTMHRIEITAGIRILL
jgi:hypothetical protein